MERARIRDYKKYYKEQMMQYDWNFTTAFHLASNDRAWTLKFSRDYIQKHILNYIKHKLYVIDHTGNLKIGIPFYAYYVICKQSGEPCYHAHMIMKIQGQHWNQVDNFIRRRTGNEVYQLKEREDVVRMINYMLMKGNLVADSDNVFMIPTGYNLRMNTDIFH